MRKVLAENKNTELLEVKKYYKKKRKLGERRLFIFSFLIIPVISFAIFYVYVNFNSLLYAFQRDGVSGPTLKNFEVIFDSLFHGGGEHDLGDGMMLTGLKNVLLFNFVSIFLGLPISILFGYFLYKKVKGYKFYRFIIYLPSIITSVALVAIYKQVIGQAGLLDTLFDTFAKHGNKQPWATSSVSIIYLLFYIFIFGFGTNMIVINGAMNSINKETLEAGQLDGCNWFQELIHVIIPAIWPTISTILIMAAAGFLGVTGPLLAYAGVPTDTYAGDKSCFTLAFMIYCMVCNSTKKASLGGINLLYLSSAVGLLMTVISFPIALVVKRVCYGKEK